MALAGVFIAYSAIKYIVLISLYDAPNFGSLTTTHQQMKTPLSPGGARGAGGEWGGGGGGGGGGIRF